MSASPPKADKLSRRNEMTRWAHEETHALQQNRCKKKDRLAAVSRPKFDHVFGLSGCEYSGVLPLPAPTKHTHRAEAGGE
jgi:acyl-CoA synthetase (AMP-forming)/AMP-acid ligase II